MPFFSVIIPTYNRATFIGKAISSVLSQSFADFELIIVDDASTDNTAEIVHSFEDSRIIYIKNETNLERCRSRNKGISVAKGQYICFLDSDDYHLSNHLQVLYDAIKNENFPLALLFTNAWDTDENDRLTERICPDLSNHNVFDYIATYTFNPQRMCIHRQILEDFQFDPEVYICEDLDLSARIATKYNIIQVTERTTVYVHHPGSFTGGDPEKPFKELENYSRIFSKPELKKRIACKTRRRLLSMCYFHIAVFYEKNEKRWSMYKSIIKSFFLYPRGYNGKTNKPLFVMCLYNFPIFGRLFKMAKRKIKN